MVDVPGAAADLLVGSGVGFYEGEALVDGIDHIIPRSRGGIDDPNNLQGMCHTCHSRKTAIEDGRWGGQVQIPSHAKK